MYQRKFHQEAYMATNNEQKHGENSGNHLQHVEPGRKGGKAGSKDATHMRKIGSEGD